MPVTALPPPAPQQQKQSVVDQAHVAEGEEKDKAVGLTVTSTSRTPGHQGTRTPGHQDTRTPTEADDDDLYDDQGGVGQEAGDHRAMEVPLDAVVSAPTPQLRRAKRATLVAGASIASGVEGQGCSR